MIFRLRATFALAALAACSKDQARPRNPDSAAPLEVFRPGIRFDPATAQRGAKIGDLVVDSISAQRAVAADSSWVGTVWFNGSMTLGGVLIRHPDSDVRDVCFEADSVSAAKMPRWAGDERRAWFCFSNTDGARRLLPSDTGQARIVVDRFTINRGLSDQVNSARLLGRAPLK